MGGLERMVRRFTAQGAVRRWISHFAHFALLVPALGLLFAALANADTLYQYTGQQLSSSDESHATTMTAKFDFASVFEQETFRYGSALSCYDECGSTALLSWTSSDGGDTLASGDGFPGDNGYRVIFAVDAEGDITNWQIDAGSVFNSNAGLQ